MNLFDIDDPLRWASEISHDPACSNFSFLAHILGLLEQLLFNSITPLFLSRISCPAEKLLYLKARPVFRACRLMFAENLFAVFVLLCPAIYHWGNITRGTFVIPRRKGSLIAGNKFFIKKVWEQTYGRAISLVKKVIHHGFMGSVAGTLDYAGLLCAL